MVTDVPNDLNGAASQHAGLRSPALSAKTNTTTVTVGLDSKQQQSHVSLPAYALGRSVDTSSGISNGSMSQSQIFASPTTASPLAVSTAADGDGMVEPHLAGHEPRYFPGVVQRRQGSTRQSSVHESDESAGKRFVGRKE